MSFASATAVTLLEPGRFGGVVEPGWDISGNSNGGYLLSIATRALREASGHEDPVTVTAHYLRPGRQGPVTVEVETVKTGRTFVTMRGTLVGSDHKSLMSVLATFGTLAESADGDADLVDAAPPELAPFENSTKLRGTDTFPPPFMNMVDLRLNPDDPFLRGEKSGVARIEGWFALHDSEPIDTIALLQASDAFPPTIFQVDLPIAWTPTVELTTHVRARPASGPLRCVFTTKFVTGGFLEEDGELWDSTGTLVAQSRQLALVPRG